LFRQTNSTINLFLLAIAAILALSSCRSDSDPHQPDPVDNSLLASVSFSGEEGVSLGEEGVTFSLPGGLVSGNWILELRTIPVYDHSELLPLSVVGSVYRVQLLAQGGAKIAPVPQQDKLILPMLISLPIPEDISYSEVAPVFSVPTEVLGQYGTAFLESTHNTASQTVDATLHFSLAGMEIFQSQLEAGVDFYLSAVTANCSAESDPQLVPLNDEPLAGRDVMLLLHGFSLGGLCQPEAYVSCFATLETELAGIESINQNFKIVTYHYPVNRNLLDAGSDLRQILDASYSSETNFTIIAYSLGGLVARSAMELHGLGPRVNRLYTLGTPHHGTTWAGVAGDADRDLDLSLSLLPHQAVSRFDLAEDSDFLNTLNAVQVDRSNYHTIGSMVIEKNCDFYMWQAMPNQWLVCNVSNALGGDGVVLVGSSLLVDSVQKIFSGPEYGHLALMVHDDVRSYLLEDIVQDFQGLNVGSHPGGAFITIDGISLGLTTPAVLEDVNPGIHEINLSLPGFNDYNETVTYDGTVSWVFGEMQTPEPPLPVISIGSPSPNANFNTNIIRVNGFIELENVDGEMIEFTGNEAVLKVGSSDMTVDVLDGHFSAEVSIVSGQNVIRARATSQSGDTGFSPEVVVNGVFDTNDIQIVLTWDSPGADLDLHIVNPLGEHCYYDNLTISDGSIDVDDQSGYGPESFTSAQALDGTYEVYVNCYALHGDEQVNAGMTVFLNGSPAQMFGPHRFIDDDQGAGDPAALWDVLEFTMGAGKIQSVTIPAGLKSKVRTTLSAKNQ